MITEEEFEVIIMDRTKHVAGTIRWESTEGNSPARRFRVDILSEPAWPLFIRAWWNPLSQKLSYTLIHREAGRIVGLDLGRSHRNPNGEQTALTHKHLWTSAHGDRHAYSPSDITEPWDRPAAVWAQFCAEIGLEHRGIFLDPPQEEELPL